MANTNWMSQTPPKDEFKIRLAVEALRPIEERFDYDKLQEVADIIDSANNIFVVGRGRSRQTAMNFGERLGQLGKNVFVVGMPTAPSIKEGDVLVVSSGSGNTATLVDFALTAKSVGAKTVLLTTNNNSQVGKIADATFLVSNVERSQGYAATSGEDAQIYSQIYAYYDYPTNIALDAIATYIMIKNGIDRKDAFNNKANLF
ncbi:MAG: SIS domain-containing protein [Clostridia bacterium]|jgi:6-phospho-3-hexuloisomerase|nr:SIS domain-containing protein [Clostridia bacterium]